MREQDTGQREVQGGHYYLFFYKAISHVQTTCLDFCIRIYRTGRLHEDEEGAGVFPVNNSSIKDKKNITFFFFITLRAFIGYKK